MKFNNAMQQLVYNKIKVWLNKEFTHITVNPLPEPAFEIVHGSSVIFVSIKDWSEDVIISITSQVLRGEHATNPMKSYLLKLNSEMIFGSFALNAEQHVLFKHNLIGSTCDTPEFVTALNAVMETADYYDDQLKGFWGGQRGVDG